MAGKKSFAGQQNPALAFISTQEPEAERMEVQAVEPRKAATKGATKPEKASTAAKLKTTDAPEGFKANPLFVETKSRRMQLLVQPSLHEAIKARATEKGVSVNELVHSILEAALKEG